MKIFVNKFCGECWISINPITFSASTLALPKSFFKKYADAPDNKKSQSCSDRSLDLKEES